MIISIAVSSNLQGAATLVGDTTSIMLGDFANMNFMDFFWMNGRPGIFFAVELGAAATIPVMLVLFRKEKTPVSSTERTVVNDYVPTVLATVTASLGIEPYLLYFGLLSGATLGGSLTPIGASANITAVGLLRKEGYHVSFGQFMKIGIPYTLAAVMTGYLYFWYIWR